MSLEKLRFLSQKANKTKATTGIYFWLGFEKMADDLALKKLMVKTRAIIIIFQGKSKRSKQ